MPSRRKFLLQAPPLAFTAFNASPLGAATPLPAAPATETISLCGEWNFRTDPDNAGEKQGWHAIAAPGSGWRTVQVPHTWQIEEALEEYRAPAWYRREFDARAAWKNATVRVEFEAVFHSARVWVNGQPAGEHLRKGYTAFALEIGRLLHFERPNVIAVRVDNSFDEHMLPRGRSSDWAHDGGIYRPAQLLVTPQAYIERIAIDAVPDLASGNATVEVVAETRNSGEQRASGSLSLRLIEDDTGRTVAESTRGTSVTIDPSSSLQTRLSASLPKAQLWHFDHPHLYRAEVTLETSDGGSHRLESVFGIRKFEVRDSSFYLNGERVFLMGVERMAGSNPEYGMAEPVDWIRHDHDDLKNLNCTFTRVHWQQDHRVLDYCDRHGIMIQTEVPTWGPGTFKGMKGACDADIMENGIQQLREMIARDRSHPSIVSWGLCNEIGGQDPPAYDFAKNMLAEAKRLDPHRLCSYASHSLRQTPGKDVAAIMDFVECNEYFGSWQKGDPDALAKSLDQIHAEIPGKPIVISEYGYCACTADRPEGDQRRGEILRSHDSVFRERPYVGGLIFFCYNDYRTHIGDRGLGVMRQRVHGVVDVYGNRKPSYESLRMESSPIESLTVAGKPKELRMTIRARKTVPAHRVTGYLLRAVYFGQGDIPVERKEATVPDLQPGQEVTVPLAFADAAPQRIQFEILRPTGFSTYSLDWRL